MESQALSVSPGVQRQIVHCVEKLAGIVEEHYCDTLTRPDDQQRTCNEEPCPARSVVSSIALSQHTLVAQAILAGAGGRSCLVGADCSIFPFIFPQVVGW